MPYKIDDLKIKSLLDIAERYNSKYFNFGVVVEKPSYTGHNVMEFIPVLKINKEELIFHFDDSDIEYRDKNTIDMWEYFKEL